MGLKEDKEIAENIADGDFERIDDYEYDQGHDERHRKYFVEDWHCVKCREEDTASAIVKALAAERKAVAERCAEIANNFPVSGYPDQFSIAKAIRSEFLEGDK